MDSPESLVFFGSGPVAAASLRLLAREFPIETVITKPAAVHHKGTVPVIDTAHDLKIPVLTVANKRELDALFNTKPTTCRLGVLIDFGIIVSQQVIDYFPLGIINSHFSILPEWRGADPISFAVLSGQAQTGVSLMQLVAAMDEGPLLAYGVYDLPPDITTPQLTEHLIHFSHALLQRTIPKYLQDGKSGEPQSVTKRQVSYSRKLTKADGVLDFHKPAAISEREVRAFLGWPRSRTTINGIDVVVTRAHVTTGAGQPGTVWQTSKEIGLHTSDGILVIDTLIPAGKREMSGQAFLSGYLKN